MSIRERAYEKFTKFRITHPLAVWLDNQHNQRTIGWGVIREELDRLEETFEFQ